MQRSAPPNEDSLQELIARHPTVIGDGDGPLLLIQREQGIADSTDGGARWSLDHLFVTRGAVPVLVEVKRASDTRLRREVVGQLLDYAANGVAYWPAGTIAAVFQRTCETQGQDPLEALTAFLDPGADSEQFWDQVDANFRAGRIKLVFVADQIPRELARIVEFLNEQMTADVRAVELRYFEGAGGLRTLAPLIIGETERAQVQRAARSKLPPITQDDWIREFIDPLCPSKRAGFDIALSVFNESADDIGVASTQGSIYSAVDPTVGKRLYPMHLQRNGTCMVSFGWVSSRVSEPNRHEFLKRFTDAVGPLSTDNINGYPAFPVDRLVDSQKTNAFRTVVRDWMTFAGRPEGHAMINERPKPDLSTETDPEKLRTWMSNAKRLGRMDVYEDAFRQLCRVEGRDISDPLAAEFAGVMRALEQAMTEEAGRTKRLNRTRQKLDRVGVRQTLSDLAMKPQPSLGFMKLVEFGMGDMSAESLILKHAAEFPPEVVSAARRRLAEYGILKE